MGKKTPLFLWGQIHAYAAAGMTPGQVANKIGRCRTTVRYHAIKHNISFHPRRPRTQLWSMEEDAALRALAAAGVKRDDTARKIGRSYNGVCKRAQELGVRFQPHPRFKGWAADEDAKLLELIAAGATQSEAANVLKRGLVGIRRRTAQLGKQFMSQAERNLLNGSVSGSWTLEKIK